LEVISLAEWEGGFPTGR